MHFSRRGLLAFGGAAIGAGAATFAATRTGPDIAEPTPKEVTAAPEPRPALPQLVSGDDWDQVRSQFSLSSDVVHLSALLIASHPGIVSNAIDEHRRRLDADPVQYLQENNDRLRDASIAASAKYLGVEPKHVTLTESTTMGLALVYHGLQLKPGQEILTTERTIT
jgi:selenocysteine lyase/cysteine desulfurase